VFGRGLVRIPHVGVLVRGDLSAVWEVHTGPGVERTVDVLLVQVLDHRLVVVASELLVVVVHLHTRSPP